MTAPAGADQQGETRPPHVYALLAVGVVCIASSAILVRFADEGPGLAVAMWRTTFAALLLLPFSIRTLPQNLRAISRKDLLLIGISGIVLGLHFALWIESLYLTSVASSTVLVTTSPIFLAIFGFVFLRERLAVRTVVAIIISLTGSVLIAVGDATGSGGGQGSNPALGNALALSAAVLVSIYLMIGRVVRRRLSWIGYLFPLHVIAALTIVGVALLRGVSLFGYSPMFYFLCLLMALFPQVLGHGSFNYALKFVSATIIGILTLAEPVVASTAAYFLFGEVPVWLAVLGMVLVIAGVALAVIRPRVDQRAPGNGSRNRASGSAPNVFRPRRK